MKSAEGQKPRIKIINKEDNGRISYVKCFGNEDGNELLNVANAVELFNKYGEDATKALAIFGSGCSTVNRPARFFVLKTDPGTPIQPQQLGATPVFILPQQPVKKFSPILPRPVNELRPGGSGSPSLVPKTELVAGFSGALITGKMAPKPIAPKILHDVQQARVEKQQEVENENDRWMQDEIEAVKQETDATEEMVQDLAETHVVKQEDIQVAEDCYVQNDKVDELLRACKFVEGGLDNSFDDEIPIPLENSIVESTKTRQEEPPKPVELAKPPEEPVKKKRGRPKGSTKKKIEERKKELEAQGIQPKKKAAPRKKLGRPPKAKPAAKTAKTKKKNFPMPILMPDSSSSSSGSDTESSEPPSSSDSSEDEGPRVSKIKMPGESLDKVKKPSNAARLKTPSKPDPPMPPPKAKSPQREQPRKASLTKEPPQLNSNLKAPLKKSQTTSKPEPAKKTVPVISERIKFYKTVEQIGHDKLEPTGYIPGQLIQEIEQAVSKGCNGVNEFARKLVGMKTMGHEGKFIISDEVNGKLGESALCRAASIRVAKGGPSLITSLVQIAGADTHQTNSSGNTALHVAAENGIPGNVATLLSFKAPINTRNNKKESALLLAVKRATKFEKLYLKMTDMKDFKNEWNDAFRCVEMLLSAGAAIDKHIMDAAETSSAADLLCLYHYTIVENVYMFAKKTLGKANLTVHDKLLYSTTIVPRDQNVFEFTIEPVEFLRPFMFLTLFAVHGKFEGFSSDLEKLKDMRLSGNPCLVRDARWHQPDNHSKKFKIISLDGFPSYSVSGPFEPGKDIDKYEDCVDDEHFITFLSYTPYRENKYTLSIAPAHWTDEILFLAVYPSDIQISDATFQKGAPEILRQKERAYAKWERAIERARVGKYHWEREFPGEECPLFRRGVNLNKLKH
ncbi:Oidioi.mRNA.OKI2018_I69.XSR.g14465.t1.cds [Oikopleura dioica]|uniref:Oidioi.mRNA.OKI2018_I69.XSR.g14465.t1.cds n=1 Tax=Oikopleura dioica TaxID=34765 RepID=A0ABN7S9V3_OIKDI|nr:Oidioi.mRNA.OKI2018_I69.XSR.g14465.t1.cds [Oikopleura dioica]